MNSNSSLLLSTLVSVATPDVPKLGSFYQGLLGIPPAVVMADRYWEFRPPGLRLGLYRSHKPEFQARLGSVSLCLQVRDLAQMLDNPLLKGSSISAVRTEGHGSEVDLLDPDGNRVVIHQPSGSFRDQLALETDTTD